MVCGDSEQTLRVLVAYYRQKMESLMYGTNSKLNKSTQSGNGHSGVLSNSNKTDPKYFILLVKNELSLVNTNHFIDMVNHVYYNALMEHFRSWYDPSAPLLPDETIEALIRFFEVSFPYTSFMFSTGSNTSRSLKSISQSYYNKDL